MQERQGISQYQQIAVQTVTPERMIVMLYEGMFRFLEKAKQGMINNDIETRTININKAQAILDELSNALDHNAGASFTNDLESLYLFAGRELNQSVIRDKTEYIDNVVRILVPLYRAWKDIPVGASKNVSQQQPTRNEVETHNFNELGIIPARNILSNPCDSGPESSVPRKTSLCVAV